MLTTNEVTIAATAAARRYGAKVVSDAAYAAMVGRPVALRAVELGHCLGNIPALDLIARVARDLMCDEDRALDDAQASLAAAAITAPPGAPKPPRDD